MTTESPEPETTNVLMLCKEWGWELPDVSILHMDSLIVGLYAAGSGFEPLKKSFTTDKGTVLELYEYEEMCTEFLHEIKYELGNFPIWYGSQAK